MRCDAVSDRAGALAGAGELRSDFVTREQAALELRKLAAGVDEPDLEAASARLLERVAAVAPELRDCLIELGAAALVRELRS